MPATVSLPKQTFPVIRPRRDVLAMSIKGKEISQGDKIVLIQDVVTTGTQVLLACHLLEKFGASIIATICLQDREEEKMPEFIERNISVHTVYKLSEIPLSNKKADTTIQ